MTRRAAEMRLLQVHLANGLLVHGVEPGTVTTLRDDPLDHGPMADEAREPTPRRHVPLARDPEHAQASLSEPLNLLRSGADMPVPRDDDQVACCDRWNPVRVEDAERAFGNQGISLCPA